MSNNKDLQKDNNLDWLKADMSDDFRQRVMMAAMPELEKNKPVVRPLFGTWSGNWAWGMAASLALVSIIAIRFAGDIDFTTPSTTFTDLALLSSAEFETIENLDILEDIDDIDLEQIRKEMQQQTRKKS